MLKINLPLILLALVLYAEQAYAKKDFRGLFGSYKREKFVENEANDTDFGFDINLSTFMPINSVINSIENRTTLASNPLTNSLFFNLEGNIFFTLDYHWQIYVGTGWYNYESRKEHVSSLATQPKFYQFEMEFFPLIAGAKYRFSTEDIVPYVGLGGGISYVRRKAYFDYSNAVDQFFETAITVQAMAGVEFYIASRVGIRLEAGAYYLNLTARTYDASPGSVEIPIIQYQATPILFRYASGIFVLL